MASQAARGKKALDDGKYVDAIKEYTAAIKESPTSPDFYIQRSTAYQRNGDLEAALADAEQAVLNGEARGKKEAIIEGQFRRGIALYKLGRLGDAEFILKRVKEAKSDHKQADMWISKTAMDLKNLPEDDKRRACTVTETPSPPKLSTIASASTATTSTPTQPPSKPIIAPAPQQTPADKIRHEWYQNTENIYFTLLAKGVPKDEAHFEITERSMSISFPLQTGSSFDLHLEPLFAAVVPEKCITRVLPSKVEIILIKATPGQKWSALESSEPVKPKADSVVGAEQEAVKKAVFHDNKEKGPAYPTSSKSGPKDWDKISKDLRVSDDGDKNELDDDDDDDGGDDSNKFFRKLFKGATPETQRAMMKSYTESNGTALSTNWEEVSKGKVETVPPDGMEAKNWSK
ncbi:hypothetical protein M409DRAFT_51369 [Zasmidium cellare ATCC 36951]|uniref:SGS-domain-containing protein n=1 Tax=Zasmidium cellare ATCC 36951 TaxID=1080233 RepID=A0A6A6CVL8_ZASCE|nr:uncharacterized protein M409DRAFT_51369 [Zasmidium cellare ATCC 36951]KAF2171161.1 hypothetical protein M409DRAFT_51369 [Zasmidium cellare ATCC 36951]